MKSNLTIEERFWSKVDKSMGKNSCWPWKAGHSSTFASHKFGYGMFNITKRQPISSHRMAWMLTNGEIPPGLCVCHHCDNPPCCNPSHLFLGAISDNNKDMVKKGRCNSRGLPGKRKNTKFIKKGEDHHHSKFTDKQIIEMRKDYNNPAFKKKDIAKKYNAHYCTIWRICTQRGWTHI